MNQHAELAPPPSIDLRKVDVTLSQREVLRKINLSILPGELFVLLGGVRSGKSTLLRLIAGLDPVSIGELWIDDRQITRLPPRRRHCAMLFQSFALWPHRTVSGNVGFGLDQPLIRPSERRARVAHELEFVGLSDFAWHYPSQLTAAQQQRVALARMLCTQAPIMLLDEPFSAQDAMRREQLLYLLRRRLQQSASTSVLSTQDPREAMRIADRIALLRDGMIQQIGTPAELFDEPRNRYVAEYLGHVNLLDGEVIVERDAILLRTAAGIDVPIREDVVIRNRRGTAIFRPDELIVLSRDELDDPLFTHLLTFAGCVRQAEFMGNSMRYHVDVGGETLWLDRHRKPGSTGFSAGDQLLLAIDPARVHVFET